MTGKNSIATETLSVDEAWIADWAAEGISALERHLGLQAAFQEYLLDRDLHELSSDDGDGRTSA
jgi:hypothetical protein